MPSSYPAAAAIGLMLAVCAALVGGMLYAAAKLGPRRASRTKLEPFECGVDEVAPPPAQFAVKYYLVAILFLMFDVEIAFFYPWAAAFFQLGLTGYLAMGFFGAVLAAVLVYEWRSGALEWD